MIKSSVVRSAVMAAICSAFLMSGPVAAQGEYDGLWRSPDIPGIFALLYEDAGTLLVVLLPLDPLGVPDRVADRWEAYAGLLTENTATIRTLVSRATATAEVEFSSPNLGMVTITQCTPPSECQIPVNTALRIARIR